MGSKTIQLQEKDFEKEVLMSSVPAVVDFYADWCGPCRMVSPIIEALSEQYPNVKFLKVDTDANQALAMKFGIMSIPTVMIFKGGKVKDTIIGAYPPPIYKQKIDATLKN